MGFDLGGLGSIIGAGLGLMGQGMSQQAQARQNEQQRQFEREMYDKSVFNDRLNWQMQNQYNLPENQMQRLKQAGLNPNLVYGNGADAQASPVGNASPTVTNSTKTGLDPNFMAQAAQQAFSGIYQSRLQTAQTNLTLQEAQSQIANRNLMASQMALNNAIKNKTELENAFGKDSYNTRLQELQTTVDKNLADIQNIGADTGMKTAMTANYNATTKRTIQGTIIDWQQHKMSLGEAASRILKNKSDIALNQSQIGINNEKVWNEKIEQKLKELDLQMGYAGYNRNTGAVNRLGIFWLNGLGHMKTPEEVEKSIDDKIMELKSHQYNSTPVQKTNQSYRVTAH